MGFGSGGGGVEASCSGILPPLQRVDLDPSVEVVCATGLDLKCIRL